MTTAGIFLLPNGTFFIELIVSIILILAIYKWVLPPINKAMEERQEKIRSLAGGRRPGARRRRGGRRRAPQRARRGAAAGPRDRRHGQPHGRAGADRRAGPGAGRVRAHRGQRRRRDRAGPPACRRGGRRPHGRDRHGRRRAGHRARGRTPRRTGTSSTRPWPRSAPTRPDGARRRRRGAASEPSRFRATPAAVAEAAGTGRARRAWPPTSRRSSSSCWPTPQLRAALTDTTVPGPVAPGGHARPARGQGLRPRPAAWPPSPAARSARPRSPAALGWLATRMRHLAEGPGRRARARACCSPASASAATPPRVHEDMSTAELESLEDDLFRFARIVASTPRCAAR